MERAVPLQEALVAILCPLLAAWAVLLVLRGRQPDPKWLLLQRMLGELERPETPREEPKHASSRRP